MKTNIIFNLFFIGSLNFLFAQYNNVNFYPPEAASLMRFVDYPVTYSTGIPDIQIPLHTVSSKYLSLPLKISFHTDNYLRLNQLPGIAGAGWSLNSEISITRVIRGMDDLIEGKFGYFKNKKIPVNYSGEYIVRDKQYLRQLYQNEYDEEPDKFYYQLLDSNGSFFFQQQTDGSIIAIPVPNDGTRITFNNLTGQFTIVDTNGTTYLFSTQTKDISQPNYGPYSIMAWKCEKIYNVYGEEEFSFNYNQKIVYRNIFDFNPRIEIYDDFKEISPYLSNYLRCAVDGNLIGVPFWNASGAKIISYHGHAVTGSIYYENRVFKNYGHIGIAPPSGVIQNTTSHLLTSLSFKGGVIEFIYKLNHILSEINIFSVSGTNRILIKRIKFIQPDYTYQINDDGISLGNNDLYCRTLNRLEIDDQIYQFTYGTLHEGNVPTDFWGYKKYDTSQVMLMMDTYFDIRLDCEGSMSSENLIYETCKKPNQLTINNSSLGSDNIWLKNISGSVLKIKYPTGGSVEFMMEGNEFIDMENRIRGCGGYRIKNIRYFDTNNIVAKEKTYKYGENENGGGRIKVIPSSDPMTGNTFTEQTVNYYYGNGYDIPITQIRTCRKRTFFPKTTFDINFDNGSNVIYRQVTEYESSYNYHEGKTIYFSNDAHAYPTGFPQYPYAVEDEQPWGIGQLDSVLYYKWDSNMSKLVLTKRKAYKYENHYDTIKIYQGRVWVTRLPEATTGLLSYYPYSSYDEFFENEATFLYHQNGIKTGCRRLIKEEESYRDSNERLLTTKKTFYYHRPLDINPCIIETIQSDGTVLNDHFVYATDYNTPNSGEGAFVDYMLNKNMVAIPIENISRRNGKIVSASLDIYNPNGTISGQMGLKEVLSNEKLFKLSNKI